MANNPTPPSIPLDADWLDVYAASGITVGTQVIVSCRGKQSAYLAESVAAPVGIDGVELYPVRQLIVDVESPGLWARTAAGNTATVIIVQVDNIG